MTDAFQPWVDDLEKRHLSELTFAEVSRALRALSSTYVERRDKIAAGSALAGAGKRAAFALFYGPLHYLLVKQIANALGCDDSNERACVVDLGCGTGVAGAAVGARAILGVDRSEWAVKEARRTYQQLGFSGRTIQADLTAFKPPSAQTVYVAAFSVNELDDTSRSALLDQLLERVRRRGDGVLIVEPIARRAMPWWGSWQDALRSRAGARVDEWRFPARLPPIVAKLDRAAGLDHRELTGRSLWIAPVPRPAGASTASS